MCAHFAPLFRREFAICPKLGTIFKYDSFQNKMLFAMLLVTKRISSSDNWARFIQDLNNLVENRKVVPLVNYGFPSNWKEYLLNSNPENILEV
jgi:abortive infection bacteriophage resistance protein